MEKRTCGKCRHWERVPEYRWGHCTVPIPSWAAAVEELGDGGIFPEDTQAAECDTFEDRSAHEATREELERVKEEMNHSCPECEMARRLEVAQAELKRARGAGSRGGAGTACWSRCGRG